MPESSLWRTRDTLVAVALFLASAAFTLWQNAHVTVLWDLTYLLDNAWRFSQGQLPYRDLPFSHAPLLFVLHAAIVRIFGRVYWPHLACAAFEAGLAAVLTWRIHLQLLEWTQSATRPGGSVDLAKPESSHLAPASSDSAWRVALFLAAPLTILGIYAIYPHPEYDSDAILCILAALYVLLRCHRQPFRAALSFATGMLCVVPVFIKQNIGLPFLAATVLAAIVMAALRRIQRHSITQQVCMLLGAATAALLAAVTVHFTFGLHNYIYWTITFASQRRLPGLRTLLGIYAQTSLLWTVPAAALALLLLRRSHRSQGRWLKIAAFLLLAAPFLWTVLALAFSSDAGDRADQLLSLWPHLLLLAAALTLWNLRPAALLRDPMPAMLSLILLATIHGAFLSQQLWGSTYAIWPLLMLLIALLLTQAPPLSTALAITISATLLLCGGLYSLSHERLSYIHLEGAEAHATLPALRGLSTPGPWIPAFEELVRYADANIPSGDGVMLIPDEDPFFFATGRVPQFPILLFDPATNPYSHQQVLQQARAHHILWLIVSRDTQLTAPPEPGLPELVETLRQDFVLKDRLPFYDIYRRR